MASDINNCSGPVTARGGSQLPASRFQEGSMNDRISAAPPVQFLGPEERREYEKQFYTENPLTKSTTTTAAGSGTATLHRRQRRIKHDDSRNGNHVLEGQAASVPRPQVISAHSHSSSSSRQSSNDITSQEKQAVITHKKSTGFFGRVRDALFAGRSSNKGAGTQQEANDRHEVKRKHSSLQEPLLAPPPPQPSLGAHYHSQSETQIQYIPPVLNSGADRPSREEVMQSYQQLMATGFFQSHAIQSTRHVGPARQHGLSSRTGANFAARRAQPTLDPMPSIPSAPCSPARPPPPPPPPQPPQRVSSMKATTSSGLSSPLKESLRGRYDNRHHGNDDNTTPGAWPREGPTSAPAPIPNPMPKLQTRDSHYALRSRKRSRADAEDTCTPPITAAAFTLSMPRSSEDSTYSASSALTQPLKRVAKKLRKMPSTSANEWNEKDAVTTATVSNNPSKSDGIVRIAPYTSPGGTIHHRDDRPIRLRSPSPAPNKLKDYTGVTTTTRRPDPSATSPSRGRNFSSPSAKGEGNRLRKRGQSPTRESAVGSGGNGRGGVFETWGMMARQQERHLRQRMSIDKSDHDHTTHTSSNIKQRGKTSDTTTVNTAAPLTTQLPQPLSVVPDVNRGIPGVPQIPLQFYGHEKSVGTSPRKAGGRSIERKAVPASRREERDSNENQVPHDPDRMDIDVDENGSWQYGEAL